MITSFGDTLGLWGGALAAIRVGKLGLKGWCMRSAGLATNNALRSVFGSNFTFFLAHAVHFNSVSPFIGHPCEWCLSPKSGQRGSIGHDGAV